MVRRYSWGIEEMDRVLGPIETGYITMIYGPTASGKTTLSTYIPSMRIAKEIKEKVGELPEPAKFIVMSTDAGFSIERARQIWELNGLDPSEMENHLVYKEFTEFDEQHQYIKDLEKTIEENGWKPLLIVLDPLIALYRGIILRTEMKYRASVISIYTGKMDLQMAVLRRIANLYDAVCMITSWPPSPVGESLSGSPPESPVIGGRQTAFLSKVMLELSIPQEGSTEREATLIKHRAKPVGAKVRFKLCDAGITI